MRKSLLAALGVALLVATPALAVPIFVAGPSPVAPFGGTVINFEGQGDGQLIDNQYAGLGVTFTQDAGGGRPQIDNLPMLFAYGPGSGVGVLTGSLEGGHPFVTVAGLIGVFSTPVARAGAFFSDTAPLGNYTITAYGTGGAVIESFTLLETQLPGPSVCGELFPTRPGCGVFVGFDEGADVIGKIQFGPSLAFGDAFAIDDFRFEHVVPEPGSLTLLGLGLLGLGFARRRR